MFLLSLTASLAQQPRPEEKAEPPKTPVAEEARNTSGDPLFNGMHYRSIGRFRGGRSLTVAGLLGDLRGNISHGDGIYKSLDAGKTWKNVGLRDSRAIGKVIVHPRNPDIVYVAALGHPYGPNTERGVFRSMDSGKTWDKVLYKDENIGAIDIAFDPNNPNILSAGLWQVRRMPWGFDSGGPGSGLYRSADAGATWPGRQWVAERSLGQDRRCGRRQFRPGLRFDTSGEGGLYRSDDGGRK